MLAIPMAGLGPIKRRWPRQKVKKRRLILKKVLTGVLSVYLKILPTRGPMSFAIN